ncbi:MAG TPA: hypothetical protein VM532_06820 [Burkholderiales bacterium]|nr:hypothetical protein [Burkholderiales bacterium]
MLRIASLIVVPLAFVIAGCVTTTLEPTSVAPRYKRMDTAPAPSAGSCVGLAGITVEDARTKKELGSRSLQERPEVTQPISFGGDAGGWVRSGAEDSLRRSGVNVGGGGKPTLRLKIERLELSENVYRRATYAGRVGLKAEVVGASGSNVCWSTRVSGTAENYGYAGSAENYEETMNHALDRAMNQLLGNEEFSGKACGCGK